MRGRLSVGGSIVRADRQWADHRSRGTALRRTILSCVALGCAAVTALTGCGSQPSAGGDSTTATSSVKSTAAAVSTSPQAVGLTKPAPGAKIDAATFSKAVWGAVKAEKTYTMTMVAPAGVMMDSEGPTATPGATETMTAKVDQSSGLKMQMSIGDDQIVLIDGSMYLKIPAAERTDARSWMGIEKNSTSSMGKIVAQSMSSITSIAEAASQQEMFTGASVTFVGDERDGAHYRLATPATAMIDIMQKQIAAFASSMSQGSDPSSSSDGSPASMSSEVERWRGKLAGKYVITDYWLDTKSRPVVMRTDASQIARAGSESEPDSVLTGMVATLAPTIRYSAWGARFTVTKPPAADVMSFDEAMKSMTSDMPTDGPSATTTYGSLAPTQ